MKTHIHQQANSPKDNHNLTLHASNETEPNQEKEKKASALNILSAKQSSTGGAEDKPIARSIGFDFNKIAILPPSSNTRIQPKLKVNPSNDKYEREADQIADKVINMPSVLPKFAFGKRQQKLTSPSLVQAKLNINSDGGMPVSSNFNHQLNTTKGSGVPLSHNLRSYMEPRFGSDFSGVRIHNNPQAVQLNQSINAKAFTVGQDIYFNRGAFQPDSVNGKRLLAHELAHVGQQDNLIGSKLIQREKNKEDPPRKAFKITIPAGTVSNAQLDRYAETQIFGRVRNINWVGGISDSELSEHIGKVIIYRVNLSDLNGVHTLSKKEKKEANSTFSQLEGEEKTEINKEIDQRFFNSRGVPSTKEISLGNKAEIAIWNSFKHEVLIEKRKIENLPPIIKDFLHSDQTFTPENYKKLAEIADIFNQFDAGDFLDYKSKVTAETTDLEVLRASLQNYLDEKEIRKNEAETRETIKTKLNNLEGLYKMYKQYKADRANAQMARQFGFDADYSHGLFGSKKTREHRKNFEEAQTRKKDEMLAALQENGFESVKNFEDYLELYIFHFINQTINIANDHLDRYLHVLFEEEKKINNHAYLSKLLSEINTSNAKQAFDRGDRKFQESVNAQGFKEHVSDTQIRRSVEAASESLSSTAVGEAAIKSLPSGGPLVKEKDFDREALANVKSTLELKKFLKNYINEQREKVRETRTDIENNPERIFELDTLITSSKVFQNIQQNSIFDLIINDKVKELKNEKILKAVVFVIIGIALAIASFGTGTPAILAATASLGLSGFAVYEAIEEYKSDNAAHDVGLLSDNPSLAWVVLAIVGAGLDVAAVSAAFKAAKPIVEATEAFTRSVGSADDLLKLEKSLVEIGDLSEGIQRNILKSAEAQAKGKQILKSIVVPDGKLRIVIVPFGEEFAKLVAAAFQFAKKGILDFDTFVKELKAAKLIDDIGTLSPKELITLKEAFNKGRFLSRSKPLQDQVTKLLASSNPDRFHIIETVTNALSKGNIPEEDIVGVIANITRTGGDANQVALTTRQTLSELSNATAQTSSSVRINAVKNIDYNLGNGIVTKINPMDEIDTLFATGSQIHAHEVKDTMTALLNKMREGKQIERMVAWRGSDANKFIQIVVESESKWTNLFSIIKGKTIASILGEGDIPLKIGQHVFSPDDLLKLNAKFMEYFNLKKLPANEFFNLPELQNIKNALSAIGFHSK